LAGEGIELSDSSLAEDPRPATDKAFDNLTVLSELTATENGVLFLWCPNCGNEIAHLAIDGPDDLAVFEIECQRCLNYLDQHALVAIEIGYPIEQKQVDNLLQDDLKECVIDYWDRTLDQFTESTTDEDVDIERLVWQFDQYVKDFTWEWPSDIPAVGFEAGATYRNTRDDERIEVIKPVTKNRNALDSFKIKRYPDGTDPEDIEPEIMDSNTIVDHIVSRSLLRKDEASTEISTDAN
jgi:hypothetical protein